MAGVERSGARRKRKGSKGRGEVQLQRMRGGRGNVARSDNLRPDMRTAELNRTRARPHDNTA